MERPWRRYWGELQQRDITGKPAPDFEAEAPDGSVHRLSEYTHRGHYVLIDFWASWCGPCIGAMPDMDEIRQTFEPKGLMVLGISIDENNGVWQSACERLGYSWLKFRSNRPDGDLSVTKAFGVNAVPLSVLISPDGTILAQELGKWDWKKKLAEILGEE